MKTTNTIDTQMHDGPQTVLLPACTSLTEDAVKLLHDMLTNLPPFAVRNTCWNCITPMCATNTATCRSISTR